MLAADAAWSWVPDDARSVRTEEYLVVAQPDYATAHTRARVFCSDRDAAEVVDEVHEVVRGFGRERVWWMVSDATRPRSLEAELVRRGGEVVERMDVLALPLDRTRADLGLPDLADAGDVTVTRVLDEASLRQALAIEAAAFDWPDPTEAPVRADLAELEQGRADDSVGRVLAFVDGRPASTGGWRLTADVCRLWGGATHPDLRGRGAYRAMLRERLRVTAAAGANLGLTHARVDTSSPILRRVGFTRYGEQRQIVLDL